MSPVISRTAAFALTIAALAAFCFGLILPVFDRFQSLDEEVQELERQLARFSAVNLNAPPTEIQVAEQALIKADSLAQAAARVQAALDKAIEASGGQLRSLRIEDPERLKAIWQVAITIDFDIDASGLQRLLHRIESQRPYLIVTRLDARRVRQAGGEDHTSTASVRLQVAGLMAAKQEPQP